MNNVDNFNKLMNLITRETTNYYKPDHIISIKFSKANLLNFWFIIKYGECVRACCACAIRSAMSISLPLCHCE